jgi:hypothetical protein
MKGRIPSAYMTLRFKSLRLQSHAGPDRSQKRTAGRIENQLDVEEDTGKLLEAQDEPQRVFGAF